MKERKQVEEHLGQQSTSFQWLIVAPTEDRETLEF